MNVNGEVLGFSTYIYMQDFPHKFYDRSRKGNQKEKHRFRNTWKTNEKSSRYLMFFVFPQHCCYTPFSEEILQCCQRKDLSLARRLEDEGDTLREGDG